MSAASDHPISAQIDRDGFALRDAVLSDAEVDRLIDAIGGADAAIRLRRGAGDVFGGRDLLSSCPSVRSIASGATVMALVGPILGASARPVRAIYFDKTPAANWAVAWHQDRTIAVAEKGAVDGYGPWSVKAGIPHVEPPVAILEDMVTIRLHLDDCGSENGPLLVMPGSHRQGRIDGNRAAGIAGSGDVTVCAMGRGGALLMRPLLLHASRKAERAGHRRVLSLDYCASDLAGGLRWHADS